MTTSLTTFEQELRRRLLDVVYGQWRDLGVPFAVDLRAAEVIDPEALLWCSLEFLPTEPRLCEGVLSWLYEHKAELVRQRLKSRTAGGDPRAAVWRVLAEGRVPEQAPDDLCHGVTSRADLIAFCTRLKASVEERPSESRLGQPAAGPSTVLLRSRNLLGGDIRHFLLLYLLASPGGGRLRAIQKWGGYTYRSIAQTATHWEAAHAVTIDHGYCRLTNPHPWRELLGLEAAPPVIVDWFAAFDACVHMLRALAIAAQKDLPADSPVVAAFRRDADAAIRASTLSGEVGIRGGIAYLGELFRGDSAIRTTA